MAGGSWSMGILSGNAWCVILAAAVGLSAVLSECRAQAPISAGSSADFAGETVDFNRDIRPLLSDKCIFCHGPDENHRGAGLRLDVEAAAKEDVIVPGEPDESELVSRIEDDDPDYQMPPPDSGKSLSDAERELLRRWIEQGAPWQAHWAYVKPRRREIPQVDPSWPRNWVDQFVLQRMPSGVQPNADAGRAILARRLYFDLLGLPPRPEEVEAFVNDRSDAALERLVDRLLDSPHFGERLAMYWFDLVRFADTVGYHGDQDHNIAPYRDWVIEAFNRNLSFDQFTREQLAGDLLPQATIEQKIASGYNRLLQTTHEGGLQPKEYIAIYAADRVRNVSAVWMGATVGCAQCHDHKYDPYTLKDFYALSAFFADLDDTQHFKSGTNSLPTRRAPEIMVLGAVDRQQLQTLREELAQLVAAHPELGQAATDSSDQRTREGTASAASAEAERAEELNKQIAAIESRRRPTMVSVALAQPRVTRILPRGNWLDESGAIVQPAIPEFLGTLPTGERRATRLDLANWLVDAEEGAGLLTARVMVNRLWYLLMGRGLSDSLDDFGGQGTPPVAPELLDQLAWEFVDSGWDIKHLVKLIVTSRTYGQSSAVSEATLRADPANQWFSRAERYRLPAESIRDSVLAVSGLLNSELGGNSARPYQPEGYYRHLNFPPRRYRADTDRSQYRRGVYVHWQRQFLHPMLRNLDAPMRVECAAARPRSNTPLAALTLLNDPSFVEAARVFAERIVTEGGDEFADRLEFAFRQVLSREPSPAESAVLGRLYESMLEEYRADPQAAQSLVQIGLAEPADLDCSEVAAWTSVARALFNLNETLTRR